MKIKFLLIILFTTTLVFPQSDEWKFSAQIQLRSELDGRDFSNSTYPLTFASLRTRVGVDKSVGDQVRFFAQLQDSRVLGSAPGTLGSLSNVDLHQGYVTLTRPLCLPVSLQAGRFEMIYGTERFFGAVGWHYIGRSFDGARLSLNVSRNIKLDLFALTLFEPVNYIANAVPVLYPNPPEASTSSSLYGFWKTAELNDMHRLDGFGYYEVNRTNTSEGDNLLDLYTIGINHAGKYGSLSSVLEAAYQTGTFGSVDIAAYLASLQLYLTSGISRFGIGADMISGTKPGSDKNNNFRVSYGTNHKFYGYMDYFINIPGNTLGAGLNDFYASASLQPTGSKFSGSLFVHYFMPNQDREINNSESVFGQEVDLTIKYDFVQGTAITWGGSLFFPGDLMKDIFGGNEDPAFWTYLMITASF